MLHGVPIVEQVADSAPGLTARFFARHARECYLGYPEAATRLGHGSGTAVIDTGNPIEPPPTPKPDRSAARAKWGFEPHDGCVLLAVGGSQGARGINAALDAWVARGLPEGVSLIWATGRAHYDAYSRREQGRVRVRPYLSPIADAYAATDVALARAGAMTTAELCAWGLPMILVPLPTAAAVPPGSEGVVVRDDWQGNRSPFKNPNARGAVTGLSLAHGPGHLFRAIYEATACGTRHILEDASAHGLRVERIVLGGGGAKSALWLQIHADILQKPVHLAREPETCALGSAMAAAVAAGIYADFDAAARAMVAIERLVEPTPAQAEVSDELFGRYVELYRRLNAS